MRKIKLLFVFCFFQLSVQLSATHILGGEIQYERTNLDTFDITVSVYSDGILSGQFIRIDGDSIPLTLRSSPVINNGCGETYRYLTYGTKQVISIIPSSGIKLAYNGFARVINQTLAGVNNNGLYLETTIFPQSDKAPTPYVLPIFRFPSDTAITIDFFCSRTEARFYLLSIDPCSRSHFRNGDQHSI